MGVLELSAPSCGVESFFSLQLLLTPGGEHFFADVAQLVEQLIRNQQVSGSSPLAGSNLALPYLIRQPIAALIPAFPLASEAAPRKLSR